MADLTSLWHAAAPPPPPPSTGPVSSSSIDTLSGSNGSRSSRPSSPSKSPLHRVLRSISPSPSQSNIPRTRSQSLGFDAHTRGDDLPADTHSPSPEPFKKQHQQQQQQMQHHHTTYDSGVAARQRTMSYTPGDQYAPFASHQQQYSQQPYAPHTQTHSVMSASSSNSLHGQYMQHQQPHHHQQQQHYTYHPHHPNTASPTAYAPQSPTAYHQQDPRAMSPTQYSNPASPTQYTPVPPQHSTTPPVSRSAYYSTAPSRHNTVGPTPTPPPRSRSPLPMPVINGAPSVATDAVPPHAAPTPPSAYEAWRTAQMQQQQQQGLPTMPIAPPSQQQPPPRPPTSVPFPNGAPHSSPISRSNGTTTGTIRRALPRPPGNGPAPTSPIPPSTASPASSATASVHSVASSSHSSSPSTSSTLSRTDSVRQAAEELMSRGVPRRGGARGFSRFSQASRSSPLGPSSSTSSGNVETSSNAQPEQEVRSSQSEPAAVGGINGSRLRKDSDDNVADGLAQRFQQSTTITEEQEAGPESHHVSCEESTTSNLHEPVSFQPPPRPSSRGAHHDVRSQGFRAPAVTVDHVPPSFSRPATFASAQQQADRDSTITAATEQPAALAPAADIPKVFSPPPNAAPPMPSIVFDDGKDANSGPMISVSAPDSGPAISVSGPEDGTFNGPSISVSGPNDDAMDGPSISVSGPDDDATNGPSISISGPDDQDNGNSTSITPSVSLSHTADHVPATPQRASATTAQSLAHQHHVNSHTPNGHQHHQHHHHHLPPTPCQNGHANAAPPSQTASSQTASSVAGAVCGGCSKYIAGRVVQAIGQCFHPDCFSCNHCGELLEHVAFYEHDGKAYCHFDYHELFSLRCFHCRTPIVDERFIQISDPDLVAGKQQNGNGNSPAAVPVRYYHDLHFFCANCGDPFMDPKRASSTAGSQRGQIQVDDQGRVISGGKAFVVWKGYPYCEGCHHNLHKPRCKSCTKPILYDVITALKGKWHPECFVCTSCKQPYPDERVFVDSKGNGYDEECYKVWLRSQL